MASFTLFRPKPMVRKSTMMERGCRYFEFPSHSKYKSIQTFIHRFFERWNDCGAIGMRYEALFAPNKTNFCLWRRTRCHSIRFGVPKKGAERVCDFFIRPRVVRTLRKPQWRSRRFLVTKPESFWGARNSKDCLNRVFFMEEIGQSCGVVSRKQERCTCSLLFV